MLSFNRNKDRNETKVNASSMADIAFLLLIFFLVSASIFSDKGIKTKLPPWTEEDPICNMHIRSRNVFQVKINANNELLVEKERSNIHELKDQVVAFITNPLKESHLSQSPKKAIISLQNDRGTSYQTYISVYNELKAAYNQIWEVTAFDRYGMAYQKLNNVAKKEIRKDFPLVISEAEPTDFASK